MARQKNARSIPSAGKGSAPRPYSSMEQFDKNWDNVDFGDECLLDKPFKVNGIECDCSKCKAKQEDK